MEAVQLSINITDFIRKIVTRCVKIVTRCFGSCFYLSMVA